MTAGSEKRCSDWRRSGGCIDGTCSERPDPVYIRTVIVAAVVYGLMIAVNGVYAGIMDTFNSTLRNDSFEIVPAGWAFSIWGLIYIWNLLFVIYSIASLFPSTDLYKAPIHVYPVYILNNLCNIFWLVVADQYIYWLGVALIILLPITLYVCIFLCIAHRPARRQTRNKYFLFVCMVNNALAVYAGWTTVACLLYTGIALIYGGPGCGQTNTGTAMLTILLIEVVVFCPLEVTVLDKYLRHTWAHYIALMDALIGSLAQNWDPNNRNSVITVAITGFVVCAFMVKICRILFGQCRRRPDDGQRLSLVCG